jgi:hypothetical protein
MDDLTRAYAVLGVEAGAPPRRIRARYKELVRRWHPDQYAGDAQGQAEAALRMREINGAHATLLRHLAASPPAGRAGSADRGSFASRDRLSREEIDAMVRSIGSESPVEALFGALSTFVRALRWVVAALFLVGFVVRLALVRDGGDLRALLLEPGVVLVVVVGAAVGLRAGRPRGRLGSGPRKPREAFGARARTESWRS